MSVPLSIEAALELVSGALERSATSPDNAASVARALVAAEAAGQSGHGLRRVTSYADQSRSGKVDGMAAPTMTRPKPGVLAVDAAHGFAYPALDLSLRHAPEVARDQGIALVAISRSHHCGVMGLVVEEFARVGLVALMMANTPAAMAPWGGRRALFGTNPIAFAAPVAGAEPVVVDLSLSKVARGKIMAAKQKGAAIPQDWAFDSDGRPTADPGAALAGTMAPAGDAKGAALAMMVEMLAAGLTGANYAFEASSFLDADGPPPSVGQTIIVIDPAGTGQAAPLERLALLAGLIESEEGARLPGRRGQALRAAAVANGLDVDDDVVAAITSIQ